MESQEHAIEKLRVYFQNRDDVVMAFVFGSRASGRAHQGSDWDIAVYFKPEVASVEWEEQSREYSTVDFLESQCSLYSIYGAFTQEEYEDDLRKRNEIERWVENIMNALFVSLMCPHPCLP